LDLTATMACVQGQTLRQARSWVKTAAVTLDVVQRAGPAEAMLGAIEDLQRAVCGAQSVGVEPRFMAEYQDRLARFDELIRQRKATETAFDVTVSMLSGRSWEVSVTGKQSVLTLREDVARLLAMEPYRVLLSAGPTRLKDNNVSLTSCGISPEGETNVTVFFAEESECQRGMYELIELPNLDELSAGFVEMGLRHGVNREVLKTTTTRISQQNRYSQEIGKALRTWAVKT